MRPNTCCPSCGYDLTGVLTPPKTTCPECGRGWTLSQIAHANSRVPLWWIACLVTTPILMVGVGVAVLRVLAAFPKFQSGAALGAAFAVGFFWNLFAMRRAQLLRPGLQKSRWNGFLIVVSEFLLAAAMTVLLGIFGGIAALLIFTVFAG